MRFPKMPRFVKIGRHKVNIVSAIMTTIALVIVSVVIVSILVLLFTRVGPYLLNKWVAGALMLGLLVYYVFLRNAKHERIKEYLEKYRTDLTVIGFSIFGIVAINCLIYYLTTAEPRIWQWYWSNQAFFWAWNVGWVIVAFLASKKDEKGKIIPIAFKILICVIVTLLFGFTVNLFHGPADSTKTQNSILSRTPSSSSMSFDDVPLEVARMVVSQCESGGRMFESDGKTPFKNRGIPQKGIKPSDAFGEYQFLESHRELARKLGFDLNTKEGQDRYFDYLFGKERFGPWSHDEQYGGGRACWGPKLAALGYGRANDQTTYTVELEAPVGEFGSQRSTEKQFFDWGASTDAFVVRDQKGAIAVYDPSKGIMQNLPYPSQRLEFKSLGDKPARVKLKLARFPLVKM